MTLRRLPTGRSRTRVYAPRLPGTYAANFESDMDWRRGVVVLWVLVGAAAVGARRCTRRSIS